MPATKVLLVYPEFPDTYWSFRHALSFVGKRSAFPPLGLLTVSAMLPAEWERRLVDMNVERLTRAQIEWADVVFLSAMLVQKDSLLEVVELCKARGKRVVVGGPFVSTSVDSVPGADHLFVGEAETTLPEFVRDLEAGTPRRVYQAAERPSLAETPVPDFALADLRYYSSMSVQYSRGCPFQCEFCDIIEIYGRVPRTKTSEQMLAELEALERAGWHGPVFVVDDNFIGNKRNAKRFLPDLAAWSATHDHPFVYSTEASVNLADDDVLLDMLRDAGFQRVFLGIETPVEDSLKEAQKGQNTKRSLTDSVRKIQGYGMEVMAGFIVGFDNDPEDVFDRQIEFIRESAIPMAMVGLLNALPDTQLWRRLEREGRLLTTSTGNNTDGSLNFVPRMDAARLVEGYRRIVETIYKPSEFYQRALECLERVAEGAAAHRRRIGLADLVALWRIVVTLGIRDSERGAFWRFARRVVAENRGRIAEAFTLAAMGYHFRRVVSSQFCSETIPVPRNSFATELTTDY